MNVIQKRISIDRRKRRRERWEERQACSAAISLRLRFGAWMDGPQDFLMNV
jgi:hypothetical protein